MHIVALPRSRGTIQNTEATKAKIAYLERAMDKEMQYRSRMNFESRIEI